MVPSHDNPISRDDEISGKRPASTPDLLSFAPHFSQQEMKALNQSSCAARRFLVSQAQFEDPKYHI